MGTTSFLTINMWQSARSNPVFHVYRELILTLQRPDRHTRLSSMPSSPDSWAARHRRRHCSLTLDLSFLPLMLLIHAVVAFVPHC